MLQNTKSVHLFFLGACQPRGSIWLDTPAFLCITSAVAAAWCRAQPWFLSDFNIFNNNLDNQEVKSYPTGQIGKQGHVVIAYHPSMVVCSRWLYMAHKRVRVIRLFRSVLPHLTVLFVVCHAHLPPLRFICSNLFWYLHWSNATLNNLLLKCCCNNNKGKQQGAISVSICFCLKAESVQSVAFSDLHKAPWRSLFLHLIINVCTDLLVDDSMFSAAQKQKQLPIRKV